MFNTFVILHYPLQYLINFLGPDSFEHSLVTAILSFGLSNALITLLILLLFALVILNEPISYLFIKDKRTEHEDFEAKYFWQTLLLIPILVTPFLWVMYRYGIFHIYLNIHAINIMTLQLICMIIIHDTYFYWTHRILHLKPFWHIHEIHHQSVEPTLASSHVFHFVETGINFSFIIWFTFIAGVLFGGLYYFPALFFVVYTIAWNIYGHGKKNLFSDRITKSSLGSYIVWPDYHRKHHQKGDGNFGFIFTFWDQLCKTQIQLDDHNTKHASKKIS